MPSTPRSSSESNQHDIMDIEKEMEAAAGNRIVLADIIAPTGEFGNLSRISPDIERAQDDPARPYDGLDWRGPNDPGCPQNWPNWLRFYHIIPAASLSFAGTFGSSVYTPGYPQIMEKFGVNATVALLPLSFYVLALGLGPILAAPISETHGRKMVYLVTPPLGILFTLGAGFAPNISALVVLRFLAGMFFSPPLAIGAGTIGDTTHPVERGTMTTLYILSPFMGPALGPVIGAFAATRKGWEWTQWTLIFFALAGWVAVIPTRETYKKTILKRRRKDLGLPEPPSPFPTKRAAVKTMLTVTLFRPMHMLFTESIVLFISIYVAFNFGVLFTFIAAFPYIFKTLYHFTTEQAGLVFLAFGVGSLLSVPTVMLCDHFFYKRQHRRVHVDGGREGNIAPEYRLYPAMLGSVGIPISLFWFAWTARSDISWASPVVGAIPFAWGNLCVFIPSGMYLVDTYMAANGASALAANGFFRYALGFAFPLFTLQMYQNLGIAWATSLLGFITIPLAVIPWVLFKYGPQIRARSSYETIQA